jgi:DNA-binding NarL/FixJ family response regulator
VSELRPILLIDDDARRLEGTLQVLASLRLANRIEVARSETEAREALAREGPGVVVLAVGRDPAREAVLLSELRREARGPAVLALAPASAVEALRRDHPGLEVRAAPLTREALLEAVENLGLAWGIVGLSAARGAYTPPRG